MKEQSINELLLNGNPDILSLWYDWFCKDSSLERKGHQLLKKLSMIAKSDKFDNEKCYVFFKNNCPCCGTLYDDFRICDIETGDVIFTVIPKSGHYADEGLGEVWGCDTEGNFKRLFRGHWREIKAWFLEGGK